MDDSYKTDCQFHEYLLMTTAVEMGGQNLHYMVPFCLKSVEQNAATCRMYVTRDHKLCYTQNTA